MDFDAFKKLALTTLLGHQHENGSWFNDLIATISAIDAFSEECGGPDPVCRLSGLYARVHPRSARRGWLFPFSWGLDTESDDPKAAYVSAVYHGITFGWRELPDDRPIDASYAWILSRWLRVNILTDADFQIEIDSEALDRFTTREPWLLAQIANAKLHRNAYFDEYSQKSPADRPDIIRDAGQLVRLIKDNHWQASAITAEETTAITGQFLAHECMQYVCKHAKSSIDLTSACETAMRWLLARQLPSGAWADSPHITAHCLKFIDAALISPGVKRNHRSSMVEALRRAIEYLLRRETQAEWTSLSAYQQIDVLAALIRVSKRRVVRKGVFDKLDIDGTAYTPEVFISYGGPDATFARRLAKDLEANGIRVWFAEWDLDYGDDVVQSIEAGLLTTKKFVIVLSPESIQRPWVRKELSAVFRQALDGPGKLIIPVMYHLCDPPPFLAAHRWVDFTDTEQYSARVQELVRRLKGKKPSRR
jgi:hypothetical protein